MTSYVTETTIELHVVISHFDEVLIKYVLILFRSANFTDFVF